MGVAGHVSRTVVSERTADGVGRFVFDWLDANPGGGGYAGYERGPLPFAAPREYPLGGETSGKRGCVQRLCFLAPILCFLKPRLQPRCRSERGRERR